jgi:hypothetical protein
VAADPSPALPRAPKKSQPVFTKKENATLEQRIQILDWYHANGQNQTKTAKHFDAIYPNLKIKQPLISAWVKDEKKWQAEWEASGRGKRTTKRPCQTQHPDVDEMLSLWVTKALEDGMNLTGEVLRQKWTKFADLSGIPMDERLQLSEGWLTRFKQRHGLKERKRHGEAASADLQTVEKERQRVQDIIGEGRYKLKDIFNMDETGLFYACAFTLALLSHYI